MMGAPAPTCHPSRDHYARGLCHPCYLDQWRTDHAEKVKGYRARWRAKNPEYRTKKAPRRRKSVHVELAYSQSILDSLGQP